MSQDHDNETEKNKLAEWRAKEMLRIRAFEKMEKEKEEKQRASWNSANIVQMTRKAQDYQSVQEEEGGRGEGGGEEDSFVREAQQQQQQQQQQLPVHVRSTSRLPGGSFDLEENEDDDEEDDQFDTSLHQQQRSYDFARASDLTKSTAMMMNFNVKDAARIGKKKNIYIYFFLFFSDIRHFFSFPFCDDL